MYLRKIRPRTTCLYSAASMLLRRASAACQSFASKPRFAPVSRVPAVRDRAKSQILILVDQVSLSAPFTVRSRSAVATGWVSSLAGLDASFRAGRSWRPGARAGRRGSGGSADSRNGHSDFLLSLRSRARVCVTTASASSASYPEIGRKRRKWGHAYRAGARRATRLRRDALDAVPSEFGMEQTIGPAPHRLARRAGRRGRARGAAAEAVIEAAEPLSLPLHSTHSKSEERERETTGRESEWSGGGHPPAGAREVGRARRVGSRVPNPARVSATSRAGAARHRRRSGRRPCLWRRAEGMWSP